MSQAAEAITPPDFNPFSPEFIADPYPAYDQLRAMAPIVRSPMGFWLATRYADCAAIMKDRRFGKLYEERLAIRGGPDLIKEPAYRALSLMMLVQDPPDHTRLRGLVVKAFTARRIEEMRPRIQKAVDALLDAVIDKAEMDVMKQFAFPLPMTVICDMLGIPEEDRGQFFQNSHVSGRLIDPTPMTPEELAQANQSNAEISAYFRDLFARRRANPTDDLTTHLVQAEEDGDKLSEEELVANVVLLFGAGHETTVNLIGNGLLALHRHPEQLAKLKADPSLIPNAVEEMLRYDSSVQMTGRTAMEDLEINGVRLARGEIILNLLGAGNRDPEAFEEPNRLDVARANVRPLSFGGGIHHCLGAQLARIEAEIAFRALFERLPELSLDNIEAPSWRPTFTLRGLTSLPARW